ncbi:MAG TPA: GntR family transcriptional regulator [Streptosporangiaceae bacterium]|nr:GntR family transcriptional regulator [Streptosporangiaceae bacterium]
MTADRADDVRRAGARRGRVPAGVLADRMAATLVHHEPGWRLPRLTAMARRFNVSAAEIDAAIDELVARHLLRRLPDGQVYRASPVEYRVPLEGLSGLASHVDPMGGQLVCRSRQVSRRRPPEDIGRSLGLEAGEPVLAIRCVWTVGGEPGALSASYLPERLARLWPDLAAPPFAPPGDYPPVDGLRAAGAAGGEAAAGGAGSPSRAAGAAGTSTSPAPAAQARALQIELAPPPPSVARSLRLAAGEPVAVVTVSFEDPAAHRPVAITTAMLRPDLFRIVIQAAAGPDGRAGGFASVWTHAAAGWEP